MLLLAAIALTAASCSSGRDESADTVEAEADGLSIFAPAPIAEIFRELAPAATFTVGSAEQLAALIVEGAKADVYAADGQRYPFELAASGAVDPPVVFATNRLVLIVPADNPADIESVDDLAAPGVELAVGAEGVPMGDYTRTVLETLGQASALDNVSSNEDDATGVLDAVASGEADAGLVYATDAEAAGDDVRLIELPAQALAEYLLAITTSSENRPAAEAFVELVLGEQGRAALEEADFGLPPS